MLQRQCKLIGLSQNSKLIEFSLWLSHQNVEPLENVEGGLFGRVSSVSMVTRITEIVNRVLKTEGMSPGLHLYLSLFLLISLELDHLGEHLVHYAS